MQLSFSLNCCPHCPACSLASLPSQPNQDSRSRQQSLLNNLQLFRTTYGNGAYPDRFDSLLNEEGDRSGWLHSGLSGLFQIGQLDDDELASLDKSGITRVMDHSDDLGLMVQGSPQNSGIVQRALDTAGNVAVVDPADTNSTGLELIAGLYPDDVPEGVRLVLFGVGPANTAIGQTIQAPPLYTELNPQETYGRFVIAVAVYTPRAGRRAQIKGVLDPKGRLVNRQVSEFWQSMNHE